MSRSTGSQLAACLIALFSSSPAWAGVGHRCTTTEHRLRVHHARFAGEDRPVLPDLVESTLRPVTVHYDRTIVSDATARRTLALIEQAWTVEIDEMGWATPVPDDGIDGGDNLDFYFDALGDGSAYTAPDDTGPIDGHDATSSYVVLDNGVRERELPYFVFHEFNHVSQFVMDEAEADPFWEWTASYIEYVTQPGAVGETDYLLAFQFTPGDALDDFTHFDTYEYGASYFLFFISQRYFGGSHDIVRDLWRDSAQLSTGPVLRNEPDHMDVLASRLAPVTLPDTWAEFSRWRSFAGVDDDGVHIHLPGTPLPGWEMARERIVTWSRLPSEIALQIAETGSNRVDVELDEVAAQSTISARVTASVDVEVSLLAIAADHTLLRESHARGHDVEARLTGIEEAASIRVIVANLGDGTHDPDDGEWDHEPIMLTIAQASGDLPDAGAAAPDASVAVDENPPPAAGCSHVSSSRNRPWLLMCLTCWVLLRRARGARRAAGVRAHSPSP